MAKLTSSKSNNNIAATADNNNNQGDNNQEQSGSVVNRVPSQKYDTLPPNKLAQPDLFPEITFSHLSIENLHYGTPNRFVRNSTKNCLTSSDSGQQQLMRSDDATDSISMKNTFPKAPDGGYGWVVVFASLVISFIADGLSFSYGLINTELLHYFGESPSKTAWIGSLFFSVPLLMGPVWSNLVDKYGCRKMTIFGGVVSVFGLALSSICNSIEMLMMTFGLISGLGLGIGYVTAVVSISFWFDKKRTFATGIGASGTGIGTFVYAPLTQYLIDAYGWRGATLIIGATTFNMCVCGALMRDPNWLIEENRRKKTKCGVSVTKSTLLESLLTTANQQEVASLGLSPKLYHSEIWLHDPKNQQSVGFKASSNTNLSSISSTSLFWEIPRSHSNSLPPRVGASVESYFTQAHREGKQFLRSNHIFHSHKEVSHLRCNALDISNKEETFLLLGGSTLIRIPELVWKSRSNANRSKLRHAISTNSSNLHPQPRNCLRTSSCPNIYHKSTIGTDKPKLDDSTYWYYGLMDTIKSIFDFSLFLDLKFALFSLSTLLLYTWFIIPYLYLPEYMKQHGYEVSVSAAMISAIGIAQTIGMIGLGYLGDLSWMNINICYSLCMLGCGLSVFLMPILLTNYSGLMAMCILFGFTFASSISFTPSILVIIVDLEDFTCAYGLILLVQGVGMITGPPAAGAIYEYTLRWDDSFYCAGIFIALSGVCSYIIEFCGSKRAKMKKAKPMH
ncbi:monocarboxylate transporter 14-like [Scaptodrosophila lebanonensis]|uniref:Monocarboxylate transporter 14-like n=1 Tax=Drosophila lebanonensis TaxID=7225 RepID=A0A6J2TRJ3_DROLE|nr:monocarboxylate transporter 14-like [Scaptodrosophila lebanonensis]